jgi:hypothetical protein
MKLSHVRFGSLADICGAKRDVRFTCACRKSNPDILVMQPAQDRAAKNVTGGPNGTQYRRVLL